MIHLPPVIHEVVGAARVAAEAIAKVVREFVEFLAHQFEKL